MDNNDIVARYMIYKSSASRGAALSVLLQSGRLSEDQLTSANILDIRTNQFKESWLGTYSLAEIPWLRNQIKD